MEQLRTFVAAHKWTVCCTALGFLLVLLLLTIGFWRTLLIAVVVGGSFWLGWLLDRSGPEGVKALVNKLMNKGNNA